MERAPRAANGRNSPPEKAEYKPAAATELLRNCATPLHARRLAILTFDLMTVRSIVLNFQFMAQALFRSLTLFFTGVLALVLAGCEGDDPSLAQSQYMGGVYGNNPVSSSAPQDSVSYWDGDGVSGKPSIKIKLSEQRAYFYKSGQLVGVSQLSTGREGLTTPSGTFSISQKDVAHVSSKYGDYVDSGNNVVVPNVDVEKDPKPPGTHFKGAPMPYFMRIVGGVGMHAGYLPGYPASHGCIRMPEFMAENFFRSVSTGTPVTISH
jgi:L,D-transpeptidase catalytic domain